MPSTPSTRPRRRTGAGASAQAMADTIRAAERRKQHRTASWALPLLVLPLALGLGYLTATLTSPHAGLAVTVVVTALALRRIYRSKGSTWATGAAGERRTRWILAPLVWFGFGAWAVLHDRQIPRSRANLDHLVLGRCGPVYVDTKTWKAKRARVQLRHGQLWYGRHPQQKTLDTVLWEAGRAAEVLGTHAGDHRRALRRGTAGRPHQLRSDDYPGQRTARVPARAAQGARLEPCANRTGTPMGRRAPAAGPLTRPATRRDMIPERVVRVRYSRVDRRLIM